MDYPAGRATSDWWTGPYNRGMTTATHSTTRLLRTLRSVRRFSMQPIPDEVLRDVLRVARWTGSSKNTQPWELVVVRSRETLAALSRLGQFAGHIAGAQAGIALVMRSPQNAFDAGRLAQNVMLAAWAHGVGSCIGSIFPEENERRAKTLLDVPEDRWLRTVISLGYPAGEDALRVSRDPGFVGVLPGMGRKPPSELVSWERYGRRDPTPPAPATQPAHPTPPA